MNHEQPTRDRILTVARALFAQHGYRGASVRAITKEAGANLGAVTYHFGTKDGLYDAVLDSLIGPLEERVREAADGPGAPLDRIEAMIAILLDHLGGHPEQARIIQHELARQQTLPARARQWVSFLFSTLTSVIAEGQAEGSIIAGPPGLMAAAAVAQPFYLNMTGGRLAEVTGSSDPNITTRAETAQHVLRLVRRMLAAPRRDS
jgi:AcrR family transcriptional regulator